MNVLSLDQLGRRNETEYKWHKPLDYLLVVQVLMSASKELGSTPLPPSPPPPFRLEQGCRQRETSKSINGHWLGSAI